MNHKSQANGDFFSSLLVLVYRAWRAPSVNYKRTELWLNLEADERPRANHAQWVSGVVMRDAYLQFAQYIAICTIVLWLIALALSLLT